MNIHVKDDSVDLRAELKDMLKKYGYYGILVRTSSVPCTCAAGEGQQASVGCPKCMGFGKSIKLDKIKMIGQNAVQVVSLPNTTQQTAIGDLYSNARAFYLEYNVHPKSNDYIFEVSWNGDRISKLLAIYKVEFAEPLRMENGRIEHYMASGHRELSNIDIREQMLKRLPLRR